MDIDPVLTDPQIVEPILKSVKEKFLFIGFLLNAMNINLLATVNIKHC